MFITKKRFEREMANVHYRNERLEKLYYALQIEHRRLLDHLGLVEQTTNKTELVKKGELGRSK